MAEAQSTPKPTMYCRKCGYVLDHLIEHRCPECGRDFDPARRQSYRNKPLRRWWLKWLLRAVVAFLVLLAISSAWIYRQYRIEQRTMTRVTELGGRYAARPLGPPWLTKWLAQRNLPALDAVFWVRLLNTQATDADLKNMRGLANLRVLWLNNTAVTDTGVAHLKRLTQLEELNLHTTQVGDAGLLHVRGLTHLKMLDLSRTNVTDEGLVHLKGLAKLEDLSLYGTKVTDKGLAHLEGLTSLTGILWLSDTQITDEGLVHLKGFTNLRELWLPRTRITDEGLVHLGGLTSLKRLILTGTRVTEEGIADLKEELPNLGIAGP